MRLLPDVPLELPPDHQSPFGSGRHHLEQAIWVFVWLGVTLRVVTFAMNFPLWGDEAFVAVNFITRGYRDLLRRSITARSVPYYFSGWN